MISDDAAGIDFATYQMAQAFTRIGRRAVQQAKERSRQLGVPNVCSINGRIYYELPNGELSLDDPGVSPNCGRQS
jgi:hypothetical protein